MEWFRSYLSTRKQFVAYKDTLSECMVLTCGVPQGSVLGPLLFIIYTNDLPNSLVHSKCILFADDTTIYYAVKNVADIDSKFNTYLTELSEWFKANKLTLNISKTNYVIFSKSTTSRNTNLALKIGIEHITKVPHVKFLGVIIDERLDWNNHIDICKNKLSSGIYAINSLKNTIPTIQLKPLYYTLIHPYLTYGV